MYNSRGNSANQKETKVKFATKTDSAEFLSKGLWKWDRKGGGRLICEENVSDGINKLNVSILNAILTVTLNHVAK